MSDERANERDEPTKLPLNPKDALRALLKVDPESELADEDTEPDGDSEDRKDE